jgi:transposase
MRRGCARVIHAFNQRGMASLRPRYRGRRPRQITTDQRQRIVSVAAARRDHQGVALTRWSLPRLSIYLSDEGIVDVSARHLGALLAAAGLSFQRTRTWKASPDPDYEAKATRILGVVRHVAARRARDQLRSDGPGQPASDGWAPRGRP